MTPRVAIKTVGITGSSRLYAEQMIVIHRALVRLNPGETRLIVGGQRGVDICAAIFGLGMGFQVHCVIPGVAPIDMMADTYCHTHEFVECDSNKNSVLYLARNARIVELSTRLLAFPRHRKEELRSGTWQCVRQMRKTGKQIDIHPLDGS